jgi:hypothetical protein
MCYLDSNFAATTCQYNVAGLSRILYAGEEQLDGQPTVAAGGGSVTGLTMKAGQKIHEVTFSKGTAGYTDEFKKAGSNMYNDVNLTFVVPANDSTAVEKSNKLRTGKHVFFVQRKSGQWFMLCPTDGMECTAGTANSGTGNDDEAGRSFTFNGQNAGDAPTIAFSLISALIDNGVVA